VNDDEAGVSNHEQAIDNMEGYNR